MKYQETFERVSKLETRNIKIALNQARCMTPEARKAYQDVLKARKTRKEKG